MKKVAILGKTGMLGSMVFDVLSKSELTIFATTREELDSENTTVADISRLLYGYDYAINCIGIIKPYIHDNNSYEVKRALEVNALFPYKLAEASEKLGIRIIQIATDCVFDGSKGSYIETDKHNAIDVYGKTKSLGEVTHKNILNLRCSIIGKELKNKTSFLEWFLNQPMNAKVNGFLNHYWNGVTTLAFSKICLGIIKNDIWFSGLQHIVPSDYMNKADILKIFSKIFSREDIEISNINASESINRTIATINKDKNKELWLLAGHEQIPTIEEMINEIK